MICAELYQRKNVRNLKVGDIILDLFYDGCAHALLLILSKTQTQSYIHCVCYSTQSNVIRRLSIYKEEFIEVISKS